MSRTLRSIFYCLDIIQYMISDSTAEAAKKRRENLPLGRIS